MLVGVLVGLAIMVGCFLVPIAHFILGPAGPFIAGYWGIQFAPNPGRHYALHGLIFGSLLALTMGVILVGVAFLLIALFDDSRVKVLVWLGVIVLTLYTGSMGTMGAMYSSLREQQRAQREAEENERES
ncbi:MAG: hypothetical protein F4X65_00480 [Chloroflexi bacterium]|nr:hypothetical protein [Chloroflexota bacterium]